MDYKKHMRYAINMAANFKYTAKPNPVVGAPTTGFGLAVYLKFAAIFMAYLMCFL